MNVIQPVATGAIPTGVASPDLAGAKDVVEAFKMQTSELARVSSMPGAEDGSLIQTIRQYTASADVNKAKLGELTKAAASGDPDALNKYSIMVKERTNKALFLKTITDSLVNTFKTLGQS